MLDFAYDLIDDVLTDEVEFLSEKVETLSLALAQAEGQVVELRESLAETLSEDKLQAAERRIAELESKLSYLQKSLTPSAGGNQRSHTIIQSLGSELNAALARLAKEERKRRDLEEEIVLLKLEKALGD